MLCPNCRRGETQVIDSRDDNQNKAIRRRRECLFCKFRFTTYERIEVAKLIVIKKNGNRESFSRDKIAAGIRKACGNRPVCLASVDRIVDNIENELNQRGEEEITSAEIGEMVMKALKKTDPIAYIRFASVYRSFTDLDSFRKELQSISDS